MNLYHIIVRAMETDDAAPERIAAKLKEFVKERSLTAHYGTPSDYIRGLIREDLKRLEQELLEQELLKGLRSGKGIPMTKEAWKRLRAEAAKRIQSSR